MFFRLPHQMVNILKIYLSRTNAILNLKCLISNYFELMFNFFFLENKETNIQGCIFMLIHHDRSKRRPFKLALLKQRNALGRFVQSMDPQHKK